MVTVYVPAVRFVISSVVAPFDHVYVYGPTPPPGVKLMVPLFPPLQLTAVLPLKFAVMIGLELIVTLPVPVHPFPSVTPTLYVLADSPINLFGATKVPVGSVKMG